MGQEWTIVGIIAAGLIGLMTALIRSWLFLPFVVEFLQSELRDERAKTRDLMSTLTDMTSAIHELRLTMQAMQENNGRQHRHGPHGPGEP